MTGADDQHLPTEPLAQAEQCEELLAWLTEQVEPILQDVADEAFAQSRTVALLKVATHLINLATEVQAR